VRRRQILFFALLIYITFDLSLPAMPGAFVFEPADSVESIQIHRGRGAVDVGLLPALVGDASVVLPPEVDGKERLSPTNEFAVPGHRWVNRRRRAILDPVPSSEDPH